MAARIFDAKFANSFFAVTANSVLKSSLFLAGSSALDADAHLINAHADKNKRFIFGSSMLMPSLTRP